MEEYWTDENARWNDLPAFAASYEPYPHQVEGFCRAAWENTILIQPTGTGKTLTAAMLIDLYSTGSTLILFIVNNVALVSQQMQYLKRVCRSPWARVAPAHEAWQVEAGGVVVGTAGSLLRLLPDMPLDRLAMVVFDEVHHATGDAPYVQVMRFLTSYCPVNPRILGLTASWLHGELRDLDVKRHSLQVTMGATIYIPTIAESFKSKATFTRVEYPDVRSELTAGVQMAAWITSVAASFHPELSSAFANQANKAMAVECGLGMAGLSVFPHALCEIINAQLHAKAAHAEDELIGESVKQGLQSLPHAKSLLQVGDQPTVCGPPSAKAQVLFDLLAARKGRTLVFVEQVCFVLPMAAMLRAHLQVPVLHVSGALSMLRETRDKHVSAFRDGECRFLVATAALEEGLDVPDCDCVVRFDSFANVKSHVQGSGRARQLGAEVFYFDNSPDEEEKRTATMMGTADGPYATTDAPVAQQPGTGEGHQWGPEDTIWDVKENKSFRGQQCTLCGAYLKITSRAYGLGKKKKERLYAVDGAFVCPGCPPEVSCPENSLNGGDQCTSSMMDGAPCAHLAPSSGQNFAAQPDTGSLPNSGKGHTWSPEDTIWDVRENKSFRGHQCNACGAQLRITVRAYGAGRKKKERTYTLEGCEECPCNATQEAPATLEIPVFQ